MRAFQERDIGVTLFSPVFTCVKIHHLERSSGQYDPIVVGSDALLILDTLVTNHFIHLSVHISVSLWSLKS